MIGPLFMVLGTDTAGHGCLLAYAGIRMPDRLDKAYFFDNLRVLIDNLRDGFGEIGIGCQVMIIR